MSILTGKQIRRSSLVLFGVPLLFVLVAVVVNLPLFDEEPKPHIVTLLSELDRGVPPEKNAYVYMAGFRASLGNSPLEVGPEYIKFVDNSLTDASVDESIDYEEKFFGENRLKYSALDFSYCSPARDAECINQILSNREQCQAGWRDNSVLMDRYRELIKFNDYDETAIVSIFSPLLVIYPYQERRLWLCQAVLHADAGNTDAALDMIGEESLFCRMLLVTAENLINKMLANACVYGNMALLTDLDSRYSFDRQQRERIYAVMRPFSNAELSLRHTLIGEFQFQINFLNEHAVPEWMVQSWHEKMERVLGRLFLQKQAAINITHDLMKDWIDIADLKPMEYAIFEAERNLPGYKPGMDMIYNPGGKLLIYMGVDYADYIYRMHNLEAFRRLVILYFKSKEDAANLGSLLNNSAYLNPYTGEPMLRVGNAQVYTAGCLPERESGGVNRCSITIGH